MGGPVEVLLVDDNPDDVDLTLRAGGQTTLDKRFTVAHDGEEALRMLRVEPFGLFATDADPDVAPSLVILDWNLPRVHGSGVIDALRADERYRHLPVVVFTGSQDPSDLEAAYSKGASAFTPKPDDFAGYVQFFVNLETFWFPHDPSAATSADAPSDAATEARVDAEPEPEQPDDQGADAAPGPGGAPGGYSAWRERMDGRRRSPLDTERATAAKVGEAAGAKADAYDGWKARLEERRRQKLGRDDEEPKEVPSYWKTEFLFVEPGNDPDLLTIDGIRWRLPELYSSLGLEEGATPAEVQSAYRAVAKAHHPDMHPGADEATLSWHMDKMRAASAAYRALRTHLEF